MRRKGSAVLLPFPAVLLAGLRPSRPFGLGRSLRSACLALVAMLLAQAPLPVSGGPIENLLPGQWYEVPNSRLSAVLPSPIPNGWTGPDAIMSAWNSGAYDTARDRLYVLGGGHADYAGNEVYQFDLGTLAWSRLTDPSPSWAVPQFTQPSSDVYADGKPASVHTYGAVQYLPNRDALWVMGGSRWHDGNPSNLGWHLNLQTLQWLQAPALPPNLGYTSAYDLTKGLVIIRGVTQTYSYNPLTLALAAISADDGAVTGGTYDGYAAAIHDARREFVVIGLGKLIVFNLNAPATAQAQLVPMSGDTAILGAYAPGLDYDAARQVLVAWQGGGDVYEIDLAARVIRKVPSAGGAVPTPQQPNGTWGRWRYVPSRQVFIGVNGIDQNVFIYRPDPPPAPTALTAPPPGQIAIPTRTWVARPLPGIGQGPAPTGSKHMRLVHNPVNGRLYLLGGDYSGLEGYDSGRNEVYSYSVAVDTWALEYPYCGPPGSVQPSHPDEVGWAWDSTRNIFWMTPGYMSAAVDDPCPQNLVLNKIMTFDPASRTWAAPNRTANGFGAIKFAVYDSQTDSIIRFTTNGSGPVAQHYDIATDTYHEYVFGLDPYDEVMRQALFGEEYYAIDAPGRVIWLIEPVQGRLYRYWIDQRQLEFVANTPVTNPVPPGGADDYWPWDSAMPIWDSVNRVLLWPRIRDFSTANITLYIFHPDTGQWEQDAMVQPNGLPVRGNTAVFDPDQNVLMVLGGTYPANPYLFLYRYGDGSGTAPPPPPPAPAPTLALTATPSSVAYNASATLTWSSTNATTCTASGVWSGSKPVSGSQSTGPLTSTSTYILTCNGSGGSVTKSATVTVGAAPTPTGTSSTSGSSVTGTGSQASSSTQLAVSDRVQTTAKIRVLSALKSGAALGTQPPGALGTIVGGPSLFKGMWWWKVDFDSGVDGWTAGNYLQKAP
ncbi:MAG: hypothetical protein HYS14_00550 [Candidatus Rokubacteria bacterium]|nr:hypothetical protein [Candidatus Rokubacteria bacterium]